MNGDDTVADVAPELAMGAVIAERYRVERELGRGGMAVAYAVHDVLQDRDLALKCLLPTTASEANVSQLFEREFHTLQQLSHPRVVAVYDYAQYDGGAFYTMEWLGGGDLAGLSPMPVERVCALLSDVCSALSLLHSRRLVHRDVTPRNIRCTDDGLAKLIDFGAIAPFGPAPLLVGTPPYCPPEVVHRQELDGRTDLFALGATAYFALTGRHAFPARTFSMLRALWSGPPRPPSHYVEGVTPELDALVLSLLSLDRAARPSTAAEVMERLCVIGGVDVAEQLVVQQAYLTTPQLVGRDDEVARVRKMLARGLDKRPGAAVIVGEAGVGRSRFMSTCVLEAKLHGAVVASAHSADAEGNFGVAIALVQQILETQPDLLDALGDPERVQFEAATTQLASPEAVPLDSEKQAALQATLCDLIVSACANRRLVLTVDDAQDMDERSAALLALLAADKRKGGLLILATLPSVADLQPKSPLRFLADGASVIKIRSLLADEAEALLRSIFGDVAHLTLLANRLHRLSVGLPGALMQLTQHLLDRNVVRYHAGAWTLPAQLDPQDLPSSVQQALEAKLASLSAMGMELARGLSLVQREGLSLEELKLLLANENTRPVLDAVDELLGSHIAQVTGVLYRLTTDAFRSLLTSAMSRDDKRELHGRLAAIFCERVGRTWSVTEHLVLAGREQAAIDRMLPSARDRSKLTPTQMAALACTLPPGWQTHLRALIKYCERSGRPAEEAFHIRGTLVGYAAYTAQAEKADVEILIRQLEHDCGYDIYLSLGQEAPAADRLTQALSLAQSRYDQASPEERGLAPSLALPMLVRTIMSAIGVMGPRYDYAFFRDLGSLEPFVSLSPALQVAQWNVEGTRALATGHYEILLARNQTMMARMDEPDRAGLDLISHKYVGLALRYSTTLVSTMYGRPLDEGYLQALDADPIFSISACHLRMLAALCDGDSATAAEYKRAGDLIRLRDNPPQMFEGSYVHREYAVYVFARDLAQLKQLLPVIERRAQSAPGWRPVFLHAQGAYQELRGATEVALEKYDEALALVAPGEHPSFSLIAGARLLALLRLGRNEEALEASGSYLTSARLAGLGVPLHPLLEATARVHASVGDAEIARGLADEVIGLLEAFGSGGLVLGGAYETRAFVALESGDRVGFEEFAKKCAALYRHGRNPLLIARYAALMSRAEAARVAVAQEVADAAALSVAESFEVPTLSQYRDASERALVALQSLLNAAGLDGGLLYNIQAEGPRLAAQVGAIVPPLDLDQLVGTFLQQQTGAGGAELTMTCGLDAENAGFGDETGDALWLNEVNETFTPILLFHTTKRGLELTAVAVVRGGSEANRVPAQLIANLSEALHQCGDVVTLLGA